MASENFAAQAPQAHKWALAVAGFIILVHHPAVADVGHLTAAPDYRNSFTIGTAGGVSTSKDAPAFSFSGSYDRNIAGPWGAFVGIGWEQGYEDIGTERMRSQSIDLGFGVTYDVTDSLGLGLGLTKTLTGKEEGDTWRSEASGDAWSIDIGVGYSFDLTERVSWGPGLAISYDIDSEEVRIDIDISVGFAF